MVILSRPEDIVAEFLRARLTDPRSRYTTETDFFPAVELGTGTITLSEKLILSDYYDHWDTGKASYTLTPTTATNLLRAVKSVKRGTTVLKKLQDYEIDLANKKIFLTAKPAGNKITYVEYCNSSAGNEWIYPNFPVAEMGKAKFPRISVQIVSKTGDRAGPYTAPLANQIHFQVDCWVKENYYTTVSGKRYQEQDLADYLGIKVENAFIDYIDDMYPRLYNYTEVAFGPMEFEKATQTYRHKQEFTLSCLNSGD